MYGVNCIEKRRDCLDIDKCFLINGIRLTGWDAGYQGDVCKMPEYTCNHDGQGANI